MATGTLMSTHIYSTVPSTTQFGIVRLPLSFVLVFLHSGEGSVSAEEGEGETVHPTPGDKEDEK